MNCVRIDPTANNRANHALTIIFDRLAQLAGNKGICRLASTCEPLHIAFCKYLLERIIQKVQFSLCHRPGLIQGLNLVPEFRNLLDYVNDRSFWRSIFDNATKRVIFDIDFFLNYVISILKDPNVNSVQYSLCILNFLTNQNLLKGPFSAVFESMIKHLIPILRNKDVYIKYHAKKCFEKVLLIKQGYVDSIENKTTDLYRKLPLDVFGKIYQAIFLINIMPFKIAARIGSTCKILHLLGRTQMLIGFLKCSPAIGYNTGTWMSLSIDGWKDPNLPAQDIALRPKGCVCSYQYPVSIFENLITSNPEHINYVVEYVISGFRKGGDYNICGEFSILRRLMSNESLKQLCFDHFPQIATAVIDCIWSENKQQVWRALSILDSLIYLELVRDIDSIIPRLVSFLSHKVDVIRVNARYCFLSIFKKSLITAEFPFMEAIVSPLVNSFFENLNPLSRSCHAPNVLLKMFKKRLLIAKSSCYEMVIKKVLMSDDSNFKNIYLLQLCLINQDLQNAILVDFSSAVTEGILWKIVREWKKCRDKLGIIELMKTIIDRESSSSGNCCRLVLAEVQYFRSNFPHQLYLYKKGKSSDHYKILRELELYIYYKDSALPISCKNYRDLWNFEFISCNNTRLILLFLIYAILLDKEA